MPSEDAEERAARIDAADTALQFRSRAEYWSRAPKRPPERDRWLTIGELLAQAEQRPELAQHLARQKTATSKKQFLRRAAERAEANSPGYKLIKGEGRLRRYSYRCMSAMLGSDVPSLSVLEELVARAAEQNHALLRRLNGQGKKIRELESRVKDLENLRDIVKIPAVKITRP